MKILGYRANRVGRISISPSLIKFKINQHDSLRLLTSTGEQVWLHTGFKNGGSIRGHNVAVDRKRGRIYVSESSADRITAFDLHGNRLWQIQQVESPSSLMVDDLTGNLWCSGGESILGGETIVFDGSGNEVAAYPCQAVDMAYDPHTDAFWLVGKKILKIDRNGDVIFREAVDGPLFC